MTIVQLPAELEERAQALHKRAFIYDSTWFDTGFLEDERNEIQALVDGGISAANLSFLGHTHNFTRGIDHFFHKLKIIERNSDRVRFCTTAAELEQCKRDGKVGIAAYFQDPKPIEDKLDYLQVFHKLGLRVLQLTYNLQGYLGAGCCDRSDAGLTHFGHQVVEECNRLGILIDLSHVNHNTSWDAIRHSKRPVAFTHVGVWALCNAYGRCKPDDLLKAVADTGGVIGIVWFAPLLKRNPETHQVLQSTVDDVLDQMDYVARLVGVDHLGVGTDVADLSSRTLEVPAHSGIRWHRAQSPHVFGIGPTDRFDPPPIGLESHSKMINITRGLVKRGYSDEDILKIMGGNWLRLVKDIWGS